MYSIFIYLFFLCKEVRLDLYQAISHEPGFDLSGSRRYGPMTDGSEATGMSPGFVLSAFLMAHSRSSAEREGKKPPQEKDQHGTLLPWLCHAA